jgi:hypothetical protein
MNKEMMKFWKTQWEAYLRSIFTMQEQGEKMLELMFSQSGVLQEESKKMVKDWTVKSKKMQKTYLDMVEANFKKIEEMYDSKMWTDVKKRT